jgi:hypothetical protein
MDDLQSPSKGVEGRRERPTPGSSGDRKPKKPRPAGQVSRARDEPPDCLGAGHEALFPRG